jgi:hypothetical protein
MSGKPDPPAEDIVRYHKDTETRIATITFDRTGQFNSPTIAARLRYVDLLHGADDFTLGDATDRGVGTAVKDNDDKFPPEWRLSKKGRKSGQTTKEPNRKRKR